MAKNQVLLERRRYCNQVCVEGLGAATQEQNELEGHQLRPESECLSLSPRLLNSLHMEIVRMKGLGFAQPPARYSDQPHITQEHSSRLYAMRDIG